MHSGAPSALGAPEELSVSTKAFYRPARVFYSYSHRDEALRDTLETHLSLLRRQGLVAVWHDRRISAGAEWESQIDRNLELADIILLLVSADFLASDYCYDVEMARALQRHEAGSAHVIPIVLRPCDWSDAPFSRLQALPRDARPVPLWDNIDAAWTDVARGIRNVIMELRAGQSTPPAAAGCRLADKYVANQHRLPDNRVYEHYQVAIDRALRPTEEYDPARESITPSSYRYELAPDEREFFERLYVATPPSVGAHYDSYLSAILHARAAESLRLGETERDLLAFCSVRTRVLLLVAPIGRGKTTILKYVYHYLLSECSAQQHSVLPVYVALDWLASRLCSPDGDLDLPLAVATLVGERLLHFLGPLIRLEDETFWQYLKSRGAFPAWSTFELDIEGLRDRGEDGPWDRRIAEARMTLRTHREFPFEAAQYLTSVCKRQVLLILDNIDPLPLTIQRAALQAAFMLSDRYGLRVVLAMRDRTFGAIAEDSQGQIATYPALCVRLSPVDMPAYVQQRMHAAIEALTDGQLSHEAPESEVSSLEVRPAALAALCRALLTDQCLQALAALSGGNLRLANVLVLKWLRTGHETLFASGSATVHVDGLSQPITAPPSLFLRSVITDNHRTYFGRPPPDPRLRYIIVNLYDNDLPSGVNNFVIRPHVLRFVQRHTRCSCAMLLETYQSLCREYGVVDACVWRAVRQMLNCNLLVSSQCYRLANDEAAKTLGDIEITETGHYYLHELGRYFEYLMFMKDDADLGSNPHRIRSCIEVISDAGRFADVARFVAHMHASEQAFLKALSAEQTRLMVAHFLDIASNSPYVSEGIAGSLLQVATGRPEFDEGCEELRKVQAAIHRDKETLWARLEGEGTRGSAVD